MEQIGEKTTGTEGLHGQSQTSPTDRAVGGQPEPTTSKPSSCYICRRRKVKCDKTQPCGNCSRMGTTCTYPPSSRRKSLPPSPELLRTLQLLEKAVKSLEPDGKQMVTGQQALRSENPPDMKMNTPLPHPQQVGDELRGSVQNTNFPLNQTLDAIKLPQESAGSSGGKLIWDQGKETYVKASLWDSFNLNVFKPRTYDGTRNTDC